MATFSARTFAQFTGENKNPADDEDSKASNDLARGQDGVVFAVEKIITSKLYEKEASFVEIYNEDIRDLLATEKGLKYDIKKVDTKANEIYVTNLKVEDVTNGEKIGHLLKRAKKNRAEKEDGENKNPAKDEDSKAMEDIFNGMIDDEESKDGAESSVAEESVDNFVNALEEENFLLSKVKQILKHFTGTFC